VSRELLPVFLKLSGRKVLLVGGGVVATEKLRALRQAGAVVTVVAPDVSPAIARSRVRVAKRKFRGADLDGQWLVVSAATPAVNRAVARAAARRRIFVNAVDDPANASAYLGGVVRRQGVTVAVSTSGRAPAMAGLLREGLDAMLPADMDRWMAEADRLRRRWRRDRVPMPARRPELLEALTRLYGSRRRSAPVPEAGEAKTA
jgi:uroporphyrin-III C-methyltransferase/precorrin-2 dehydrogenase/sirohydrochlorin ferrochelatase